MGQILYKYNIPAMVARFNLFVEDHVVCHTQVTNFSARYMWLFVRFLRGAS